MWRIILLLFYTQSVAGKPEDLLAQMSLEEKAGQMTQVERGDIIPGDIAKYALGSVLGGGGSVPERNDPYGWVDLLNGYLNESSQTRLKIPIIYGIDAVHGNNNIENATIFPHNVGYGATAVGDESLGLKNIAEEGAAVRDETIACGIKWTFAPMLGNPQDVRWGRTFEGFSENITIPTLIGSAFIRALQDGNEVSACMKHYIGEGYTTNGVNGGDAVLTDDEVRAILDPYAAAVKAGAWTVMPSYNSINGLKCTENPFILQTLLKDELGFPGFVISDYGAVWQMYSHSTYKEELASAINAGLDMVMACGKGRDGWIENIEAIVQSVVDGSIPLARVDDAVLRILRVKEQLGILADDYKITRGEVGTHRALARTHAADTLVLLKNRGRIINLLPSFTNFLVAGEGADDIGMQCGGWTLSWQGGHGPTVPGTSILQGFLNHEKANPAGRNFVYSENATLTGNYDAVIVVVGEDPYAEGAGDVDGDVSLRPRDRLALENAYKQDVPVVVIILSGRPLNLGDEDENWDGLIAAFLPGSEAGDGIADVLFGEKDFVAKTPYTWRKTQGKEVSYPYGHGLRKAES